MSQAARSSGAKPGPFRVPTISRLEAGLASRLGSVRGSRSLEPLRDGLDPRQRRADAVDRLGLGGTEGAADKVGHRIRGLTNVEIALVAKEGPDPMLDPAEDHVAHESRR